MRQMGIAVIKQCKGDSMGSRLCLESQEQPTQYAALQ